VAVVVNDHSQMLILQSRIEYRSMVW